MLTKVPKNGLNAILIVTMLGMGTGCYIPTAYAESTAVTEGQETSNLLSKLEIEGIKLDKDFLAGVNEYAATVENNVQSINLLVESGNPDSLITINGASVKNGNPNPLLLQTGKNVFLISVKDSSHSINTYTLSVTRKQNANNLLQNIKLSTGQLSPAFSSAITEYTVPVKNDTSALTVLPSAVDQTATVEVNGVLAKEEGVLVKIPTGKSDILINVTAENGMKKSYTIHVERAEPAAVNTAIPARNTRTDSVQTATQMQNSSAVQKMSKATLSALTVSGGTWDSTFSASEYTYHVAVSNDTKTITIEPTASFNSSTILIEGSTSKIIQLEDDQKTIISVVVSNDDDDRKTYVLVFDRKE
ncbi:cadherin-like beta sandwich domain-containing protein [Bacillus salipaludis]|uniref:Cadherin-like beta sandwich domain-containing protein n=1 Tax=Bacillus salipaludis TaxID=2547811 RepID=A0ABW8RQ15_9BACI